MIILGKAWQSWHDAIGESSDLWKNVPQVRRVIETESLDSISSNLVGDFSKVVVIPISKQSVPSNVGQFFTLSPSEYAISSFGDKENLYHILRDHGLDSNCPEHMGLQDISSQFPVVLKRVDLFGGIGIEFVKDRERLNELVNTDFFLGKRFIIQEYVEGSEEYVTHVLCRDGKILWSETFVGPVPVDSKINRGPFAVSIVSLEPKVLEVFNSILEIVGYSGMAAINYKLRDNRPIIFEINPRFGGSLFKSEFRESLVDCVRIFCDEARPQTQV